MDTTRWDIERRNDGAILVRVRSDGEGGGSLPDAVFAFRDGDPQFKYWEARYEEHCVQRHATALNHH